MIKAAEEMNEKKVKSKRKTHNPGECQARFPELEMKSISDIEDSFTGDIVGRDLCHAWFDVDYTEKTVYDGKVEKVERNEINYVQDSILESE